MSEHVTQNQNLPEFLGKLTYQLTAWSPPCDFSGKGQSANAILLLWDQFSKNKEAVNSLLEADHVYRNWLGGFQLLYLFQKDAWVIVALGWGNVVRLHWPNRPVHRPSLPAVNRFWVEKLPGSPEVDLRKCRSLPRNKNGTPQSVYAFILLRDTDIDLQKGHCNQDWWPFEMKY